MLQLRKKIQEEKGSATLEFIMVMPYYLFFMLLLWQAVASGITIMQAQSAVNEAAKIYAVTKNEFEAKEVAENIIGHSDIMTFEQFHVPPHSGKEFTAEVKLKHGLVFVPKEWRNVASVGLTHSASGRVIE
ncbi:TadE/TadG family type IV pilus assembly protein [Robertmurraya siralis]|uniref:TadE/TadG family type IV pilus assembly protein n=1 Tax=Robertmurraya siralis TaxID=77777 RepID=UPI0010F5AA40|nr:TadE family protein [Robertmurraya siralis]